MNEYGLSREQHEDYRGMVEVLGGDALARRCANALFRGGVTTVEQLASTSQGEIFDVRHMGPKSRDRIQKMVRNLSTPLSEQAVDHVRVAAYLVYLGARARGESGLEVPEMLNATEREQVAKDLDQLASWYGNTAKEVDSGSA